MKASKRVSYPCDTWLILIITSYPIALERCGPRKAGGNAHAALLNHSVLTYRDSLNVARVRVCSGFIVYIYIFR